MAYELEFISQNDFEKHVANTIKSYSKSLLSINLEKFNRNIIDPIKMLFDKNIFQYIANCEVPKTGWDVIYTDSRTKKKIYVELKNKHNTMNSGSAQKIYIQMQNQIMKTPANTCFLVEAIAPKSRNISWGCSINGLHVEDERIRRVSIDKFYEIVTGISNAFYQVCMQLSETIEKLVQENQNLTAQNDTVFSELRQLSPEIQTALFKLAFQTYEGFQKI
ncbi:MAG: Eco47II family restriction endonuclease [Oscillospiraceae bacterium]|nr:Eco47II family restriction endonuclease [Oscillospiraceae bacterium]